MDEVRRNATRPPFRKHQALALDPWKTADARPDRHARSQAFLFSHFGQAGILERLAGRVDRVDDERIDLALHLVVDALVGVEAVLVILGLHFARDLGFVVAGIEASDRADAAFAGDQVPPRRLHVAPERRYQPQTRHNDTAHLLTPSVLPKQTASRMRSGSR